MAKNNYITKGKETKIELISRQGVVKYAVIDTLDLPLISDISWHLLNTGYVAGRKMKNSKYYLLHRFILNPKEREYVDHMNRDKLDNRRNNLRVCTQSENCLNSNIKSNNKSGIKGVCPHNNGQSWRASIMVNGKSIRKSFSNLKDAILFRQSLENNLINKGMIL